MQVEWCHPPPPSPKKKPTKGVIFYWLKVEYAKIPSAGWTLFTTLNEIKLTKNLNLDCSPQFLLNKSKSLMDTIYIKRSYVYM